MVPHCLNFHEHSLCDFVVNELYIYNYFLSRQGNRVNFYNLNQTFSLLYIYVIAPFLQHLKHKEGIKPLAIDINTNVSTIVVI